MNLQKLFEMQAKLDADITAHHPVQEGENRLEKKALALLVELGECANEWRGFKFWSNDQEPKNKIEVKCWACNGTGMMQTEDSLIPSEPYEEEECGYCEGKKEYKNPLLEEYVDCLHFILSVGNDLEIENFVAIEQLVKFKSFEDREVLFVFRKLYLEVSLLLDDAKNFAYEYYPHILQWFLELGYLLGFTWEQVEQAYYDKNKVNFERQEQGY